MNENEFQKRIPASFMEVLLAVDDCRGSHHDLCGI